MAARVGPKLWFKFHRFICVTDNFVNFVDYCWAKTYSDAVSITKPWSFSNSKILGGIAVYYSRYEHMKTLILGVVLFSPIFFSICGLKLKVHQIGCSCSEVAVVFNAVFRSSIILFQSSLKFFFIF